MSNHPLLLKGIEEFNQRRYFDCHETLEELWMQQSEPEKVFTQGLIQIAVGYFHHLRGNDTGAVKLLRRGLERIGRFRPEYCGIDVERLVREAAASLETIETGTGSPTTAVEPPCIHFHAPGAGS